MSSNNLEISVVFAELNFKLVVTKEKSGGSPVSGLYIANVAIECCNKSIFCVLK